VRRLVLAVLITLGLLTVTQPAAVAKSTSVLTYTVTERPSDLFSATAR